MTMCTQCTEVLIVDIAGDAEKFGKRKRPPQRSFQKPNFSNILSPRHILLESIDGDTADNHNHRRIHTVIHTRN